MEVILHNTTKRLCVIGDPVGHSRSPLIQNAMVRALGLDYLYYAQPVPRGQAARWLDCARFTGVAGFNATMPHKEELFPLMDAVDDDARRMGAVNTVALREGKTLGFNTDGAGFCRALEELGGSVTGSRVLLLGAGGAARAVALKLAREGAEQVTVANRTLSRAEELCALDDTGVLQPAGFDRDSLCTLARSADVLVNCTSLGMEGTAGQFSDFSFLNELPRSALVCELIYAPPETELLARARLRGLTGMNGLGMLLHQAVLALEHFVGSELDQGTAIKAARAALGVNENAL